MTEISMQTKKFQKELNSGTSSLVLLSVLSLQQGANVRLPDRQTA